MAQPGCFQSIQVCALRVTRLDATGAFTPGQVAGQYLADSVIEIESDPQYTDGDEIEVTNGCGDICSTFRGDDRLTGLDFSTELCELDAELIEILTGVTVLDDGGAPLTLGWQLPLATATPYPGVIVEAWSRAWADTAQSVGAITAATLDWWKWVWPRLRLRVDAHTLNEEFLAFSISGPGDENPTVGTIDPLPMTGGGTVGAGPGYAGPLDGDWPISPGVIVGREAVFLTDTQPPTAICGWVDVVD